MLDVVVLTVNPETFAGCVKNLDSQEVMYHGIVVQNGPGFLRPPDGWTHIPGNREQNYATSINRAFEHLRGDRVVLCSDDARLWPDCLQAMRRHDDVAVVGSVLVSDDGLCNHVGMELTDGKWPYHLGRHLEPEAPRRMPCEQVDAVTYALVMIDREAVEKVGGMDTAYQWSHEDIDYGLRIREAGFGKPVLCTDAFATHNERGVEDTPRDVKQSQRRYAEVWIDSGRIEKVVL